MAGCISPDFENFFFLSTGHEQGHTLAGLFYFDLPVAFLISLLFHNLVRDPLTANLPGYLRNRLSGNWTFPFLETLKQRWPVFILSVLIGAASHIGWDNLTHNGWAAMNLEFYRAWSVRVGDLDYPPFYVLQQISTVLGTTIVLTYLLLLPPAHPVTNGQLNQLRTWWFWPMLFSLAGMVMFLRFNWPIDDVDRELGNLVIALIGSTLAGLLVSSLAVRTLNGSRGHY